MISFSRIAFVLAAGLAFSAPALAQDDISRDTVLARVNGAEITLGHVIAAREALPEQFRALPADALFQPLIEQLIEQTALMQISEDGLTARERIILENERRAFVANATLTRVAEAAVTDELIDEAYASFVEEFNEQEPVTEFNASHIIVETEEEALALLEQLEGGADFADLAREHSQDGAAANGGNLGWFGPGVMIPEFEEAVEAMAVGDFTGPLETRFGWHLVLLNDMRDSQAPSLDEIREPLVQTLQREAAEAELARATEAATIERNYEGLDLDILNRAELLDD